MQSNTRRVVVGLAFAWSTLAGASTSDLPGVGRTVDPRLMIIFDTSQSMSQLPGNPFVSVSAQAPGGDYEGPATECQSKFCFGKAALSTVLDAYKEKVEMGLAGYYQYVRKSQYTIQCRYDVLAPPGRELSYVSDEDKGSAPFACQPSAAACPGQTAQYTCQRAGTADEKAVAYPTVYHSPSRGGDLNVSAFTENGRRYVLRDIDTSGTYSMAASSSGSCRTAKQVNASFDDNTGVLDSACTASNPCRWYFQDTVTVSGDDSRNYYQNRGQQVVINGRTYRLSSTTLLNETYAPSSTGCRSSPWIATNGFGGCSSGTPCDMQPNGQSTQSVTENYPSSPLYSDRGASLSYNGKTFVRGASTLESGSSGGDNPGFLEYLQPSGSCSATVTETSKFGCSSSNPCTLFSPSVRVTTGENPKRFCQYKRRKYPYVATYSQVTCKATRTRYRYVAEGNDQLYCRYRRKEHRFYAPSFRYTFKTLGGELVDTFSVNSAASVNHCTSSTHQGTFPDGLCPSVNVSDSRCQDGAQCPLRWRKQTTVGALTYDKGRNSSPVTGDRYNADPSGCLAVDRPVGAVAPFIPQPTPSGYTQDWCSASGGGESLVADYYDENATNQPPAGVVWSPYLPKKTNGWSGLFGLVANSDGSPYGSLGAQTFVPMGRGVDVIDSMLRALRKADSDNPTGFRMPDEGGFTPLFGSLVNAKQYLEQLIADDPDRGCRAYRVLLVTDGAEQTPKGYTRSDLVRAVTDLRNLSVGGMRVDVKTYVVGFGGIGGEAGGAEAIASLNEMARAAGTAADPALLAQGRYVVRPNGVAFDAATPASLLQALQQILANLTAGRFSRSKPVQSTAGDRLYTASFTIEAGTTEWTGHLHAFQDPDFDNPLWRFEDKLNAQTSSSRVLYTSVDGATRLRFDANSNSASQQTALYDAMAEPDLLGDNRCHAGNPAACNAVIRFIRNDGLGTGSSESFANGQPRASRLGHIYHSSPALVGPPSFDDRWAGASAAQKAGYRAFKAAQATRDTVIYVGSNGGMVHAVKEVPNGVTASQGTELWAYVPPFALPKLATMRTSPQFTVDGEFGASDVCSGACTAASDWRTVVLGTLREGGAGVYALDVTQPQDPRPLWAFTDGNLGNTWSPPMVGKVKVRQGSAVNERWAAFMGGGVSAEAERGDWFYALDVLTGQPFQNATAFSKFRITDPSAEEKNNVPARPALAFGEGPLVTAAYVGDVQGRLSKVSLTDPDLATWKPFELFDASAAACKAGADVGPGGGTRVRLSQDNSTVVGELPLAGALRPIFSRPVLGYDSDGRRMLVVGTGDPRNPTQAGTTDHVYAVRDLQTNQPCSGAPAWVKRLGPGEKLLSDPLVVRNVVVLATYTPPKDGTGCNLRGDARLYAFALETGEPVEYFLVDGVGTQGKSTLVLPGADIVSNPFLLAKPDGSLRVGVVDGSGQARVVNVPTNTATFNLRGFRRTR